MCFGEAIFECGLNIALGHIQELVAGDGGGRKGGQMLLSKDMACSRRAAQHLTDFPTTSSEKAWKT